MSLAVIGKGGAAVKVAPPVTQTQVPPPAVTGVMLTGLGVVCECDGCERRAMWIVSWVPFGYEPTAMCNFHYEGQDPESVRDAVRIP